MFYLSIYLCIYLSIYCYLTIKAQSHFLMGRFPNKSLLRVYVEIAPWSGDTPQGYSLRLSERDCHHSKRLPWVSNINLFLIIGLLALI